MNEERLRTQGKVSNEMKATAVGGGAGVGLPWLAIWLQQRYGVPMELSSLVIGAAAAWLGRWAAKLHPGS